MPPSLVRPLTTVSLCAALSGCFGGLGGRTDSASEWRAHRQILVHGRATFLCAVPRFASNVQIQLLVGERVVGETAAGVDGQFSFSVEEPSKRPGDTGEPLTLESGQTRFAVPRTDGNNYRPELSLPCPD